MLIFSSGVRQARKMIFNSGLILLMNAVWDCDFTPIICRPRRAQACDVSNLGFRYDEVQAGCSGEEEYWLFRTQDYSVHFSCILIGIHRRIVRRERS